MENLERLLEDNGYKITDQRKVIYEILMENKKKHLDAKEIESLSKKTSSNIGIATVYRTLDIFMKIGLVSSIDDKYELKGLDVDRVYPHYVCSECGEIFVVDKLDQSKEVNDQIEKMAKELGFEINTVNLNVKGKCSNCIKK